ncbi:MAG: glycosyltransferase family 39 protein [Cytophagales bacterium]|nr:glycosyltransferase family 39 protein [Cytophagales bacterium]
MDTIFKDNKYPLLIIGLLSLSFFVGIGHVHLFDWDEINFAECAREMIVSGDYVKVQMDFQPFWEKPPFFFWLQVIFMKLFGIGEFSARFPNALFGGITLFSFYFIGKKHFDRKMGLLWSLIYAGSIFPLFYFKSGIIDPVFNYFIFISIYFFIRFFNADEVKNKYKFSLYSGIVIGLAMLTKGPVGLLLFLLTVFVYLVVTKFKNFPHIKYILVWLISFVLVIMSWWIFDIINNGFDVVKDFIDYQISLFGKPVAGHKQPWYYHFVVVLLGCFPMSFFALKQLFAKSEETDVVNLNRWMNILLWVVLILFTIVTTKIIHYSSMTYIPLSFLATYYIYRNQEKIAPWMIYLYLGMGLIISIAVMVIMNILPNKEIMSELLSKDQFSQDSFLQDVQWGGYEFLGGLLYMITIIGGFILLLKRKITEAFTVNAFGLSLFFIFLSYTLLPKVEQYVQGPAISFYESVIGKDVYLHVDGYKSYGRSFYSNLQPMKEKRRTDKGWLMNGEDVDKDVYIVTKTINTKLENNPKMTLVKQEGGFRMYYRKAVLITLEDDKVATQNFESKALNFLTAEYVKSGKTSQHTANYPNKDSQLYSNGISAIVKGGDVIECTGWAFIKEKNDLSMAVELRDRSQEEKPIVVWASESVGDQETNQWNKVTKSVKIPDKFSELQLKIYFYHSDGIVNDSTAYKEAWVDDVSVRLISSK